MTSISRRYALSATALLSLSLLAASPAWAQDEDAPAAEDVLGAAGLGAEAEGSGATVSDPEARFHILAGEMAAARSQPALAAVEFLAALEKVDDPALAARATGLAFSAGNAGLVERSAKRWLELQPNNMDPREVLMAMALQRKDVEGAYEQADAIINGHGAGRDEGFQHVAVLMVQQPGTLETAVAVLKHLVEQYPKEPGAYYASGLLALRLEHVEAAEVATREAVRLRPESKENSLLLIGVLVRQQKLEDADQFLDALVKRHPKERSDLRMAYAKLLVESKQRDRARKQIERVLKDMPKNQDARFALGVFELNDGELDAARKQFKQLADHPERGPDARFQLGRIAELEKDYPKALEYYESVSSGTQALDATLRRAAVLVQLGRYDEAHGDLERLRDQYPPLRERLLLAEGEILLGAGQGEKALAAYDEALKQLPDNLDLLYGRSLAYDQLGRSTEAETDLRAIIKQKPEDARALNALGYMLSNEGAERLPEARDLIEKALKLNPEDPAIIDSLGWVSFKLGEQQAARDLLSKAHKILPDPEIAAHLGEVLWTLGQRDEAQAVWQAALKDSPDHTVLKETIQRLTP